MLMGRYRAAVRLADALQDNIATVMEHAVRIHNGMNWQDKWIGIYGNGCS
jgi:hypothetical protein